MGLWGVATGANLRTLKGHSKAVNGVAYSTDGGTVASASDDKSVRLWDAANGALLRALMGHEGEVWCVAFALDDASVVASGGGNEDKEAACTAQGQGHPSMPHATHS